MHPGRAGDAAPDAVKLLVPALNEMIDIILDMEYPRLGLIRVDSFDQTLADLRASM